jgi:hypothetical protein
MESKVYADGDIVATRDFLNDQVDEFDVDLRLHVVILPPTVFGGISPMPFLRDFDQSDRILRTTIVGPVSLEDIDDHLRALRRRRGEGRPELIDARQALPGEIGARTLLLVANRARFVIGTRTLARRAVVVSNDTSFIFARRFATFVAGWMRLGVFYDMESALEWVRQPDWVETLARMTRVASL